MGLVFILPNPIKFSGWSTRSPRSRMGNSCWCTKLGITMFTWLPLSAKALISHTSTTRLTRVSGPTQCAVGPLLKSEEVWHMVAMCAVTSVVRFFWGRCLRFLDQPLWSLNAPCAKCRKSHSVDNPWQIGQSHHTRSISIPLVGSGS